MTMTIEAVYEAGRFRPVQPEELASLDLAEGKQVRLTLDAEKLPQTPTPGPDPRRVAELLAEIAAMPMEPGGKAFDGADHDRILYGGPEGAL